MDLKLSICSALRCLFYSFLHYCARSVPHLSDSRRFMFMSVCAFCVSVQNPCADQNGGCMHECRVDGGRAHCDCKVGYILAEDGKTCEGK